MAAAGPQLVLFLLCWSGWPTSGAFFAGRRFGRQAGAAGQSRQDLGGRVRRAVPGGGLSPGSAARWFDVPAGPFLALCARAVVLVSVVGDLTESMFKRYAGVKDSGTIFPGPRRRARSHRQPHRGGAVFAARPAPGSESLR